MKLHSTLLAKNHSDDWEEQLTPAALFPEKGAVRDVCIISAYTDLKMLRRICKLSFDSADRRSGTRIRIYLDRLSSTYENDNRVKRKMNNLEKKLQQFGASGSGIWLVKIGSLFHAKAVVIETNTDVTCMVGSLNMTEKAFKRNEELVLLGQAASSSMTSDSKIARWILSEYCDALQNKSQKVPFADEKIDHDSLQSLMLSGLMFHEIKEADPFRFNIGLPKKLLEIEQQIHPLMKAELKDSISIESIITGTRNENGLGLKLPELGEDGGRESWKKYCLDTCYGYWCPDWLRTEANQMVNSKALSRQPKFKGKDGIFTIIKTRQEDITTCFYDILTSLDDKIRALSIHDAKWDVKIVRTRWMAWYERLIAKLENKDICDRIILGVYSSPVPNVWSDPITSTEFETSFIESLQYAWSKGEISKFKRVINTLKDSYQLDPDIMREGNMSKIMQHLDERLIESSKQEDDSIDGWNDSI